MSESSYWRQKARPIVADILRQAKAEGWTEKDVRRALREAYPFGPREYHPYKIWLDEIARQRRHGKYNPLLPRRRQPESEPPREQRNLFNYGAPEERGPGEMKPRPSDSAGADLALGGDESHDS